MLKKVSIYSDCGIMLGAPMAALLDERESLRV